jgi:tetratricopeptide (TPR) repeat protein
MDDVLFGMETELAFSALRSEGSADDESRANLLEEYLSLAEERLRGLRDQHAPGFYLENGSRLYVDAGLHPEICTPECRAPEELVRWQLADERILTELSEELEKLHPETRVALFRCNVDYSGSGETWGCHESYQHRSAAAQMSLHLIPHLASRIVYTGAGGLNNQYEQVEFLMSPRVPHLMQDESGGSQSERGLYHTKNEPLGSGGFNRLHLICGESNSSQLSNYLKFGTTALIVRLIDAGLCRGNLLGFQDPRSAMLAYARDPACRAEGELDDGRHLTAAQVQREYLEMVEHSIDADFMPDWAPNVVERWRRVLDQLETDPAALSTSLDWAIKHALLQDRVSRAGTSWDQLSVGNGLAAELCEIDTRFGELGSGGLFNSLDRAGVLDHQLSELQSVEEAMTSPPIGGRAEVRGRVIRELQPHRDRYCCSWEWIQDKEGERMFDMRDPFGRSPTWREIDITETEMSPSEIQQRRIARQLDRGTHLYKEGQLSEASELLASVVEAAHAANEYELEVHARFWWSKALGDAGNPGAAERTVAPILNLALGSDRVCAIAALDRLARRILFSDHNEDAVPFWRRLLEIRDADPSTDPQHTASALNNLSCILVGLGEYAEAEPLLIRATELRTHYPNPHYWLTQVYQRRSEEGDAGREVNAWRRYLEIGATNPSREREGVERLAELDFKGRQGAFVLE